jgi:TatD DNase family protein
MNHWIDAHTHLDASELYPQRFELLKRAEEAGVQKMLLVNSEASIESMDRTVEVALLPGVCKKYVSLGIHPHHASEYSKALEADLQQRWQNPLVIAVGEIGLDYFYNFSPKDKQIEVLKQQLKLSLKMGKPVVIHCRDAYPELAEILKSESDYWKGMIHCFTGNVKEAELFLNLGFHISFSGIVTFRNAMGIQEAAKEVPVNRMLMETDAPYLAPVPKRGKTNEPAFVIHTGEFLARLKGLQLEDFGQAMIRNFDQLFL